MNKQELQHLTTQPAVVTIAVALLAVVLLVFLVQTYGKAYRDYGYDFTSYLLSGEAMLHGENAYQTDTPFVYMYPMFLAFSLIPLSVLPYWLSNFLWYVMNVAALFGSLYVLIRLTADQLHTRWSKHLLAPVVLALLLVTSIWQNHLLNGQVNFIVLFLCVLFLKYETDDRWIAASICLAAAAAIKLVPLILLGYLLLRLRSKNLLLTVGLFAVFCLLPVVFLGSDLFSIYQTYLNSFVAGNMSGSAAVHPTYYTLHGLLVGLIPPLAGVSIVKYVAILVVILSVGIVDLLARRRAGSCTGVWTFHLYLLAILLISPMSETHHLAFLLPVFVLLTIRLLHVDSKGTRLQTTLLISFVVLFHLGRALGGPSYAIGILALFLATASIALRTQRKSQPPM